MSEETSVCMNCGKDYFYDTESSPEYCAIVCSYDCNERYKAQFKKG